jgi:hypothetical protein
VGPQGHGGGARQLVPRSLFTEEVLLVTLGGRAGQKGVARPRVHPGWDGMELWKAAWGAVHRGPRHQKSWKLGVRMGQGLEREAPITVPTTGMCDVTSRVICLLKACNGNPFPALVLHLGSPVGWYAGWKRKRTGGRVT